MKLIRFNAECRSSNLDTIEELTILKGRKARQFSEEPIVADNCLKQMEELQEVKMSNERKITELGQLYSKQVQRELRTLRQIGNSHFNVVELINKFNKSRMEIRITTMFSISIT